MQYVYEYSKHFLSGHTFHLLSYDMFINCESLNIISHILHWGKCDDRNCSYGHPKVEVNESGQNYFHRFDFPIIKGILSKLTIKFWMCQKCDKMNDYN
jgi:hypothetical protein